MVLHRSEALLAFSVIPIPELSNSIGRKKTACGVCARCTDTFYDHKITRVPELSCGDTRIYLELPIRRVLCQSCGTVVQEKRAFLTDNPFYTKRFAVYVGNRCSISTIKDVAKEFHLDHKTFKEQEKQYLREKLRAGAQKPNVIGIDELSIRKGHTYRSVVSDLQRKRTIWFGAMIAKKRA